MMERWWNLRSLSVLKDKYYSLNSREQWAVKLGALALLCFFAVQFVLFPLDYRAKRLESSIRTKEKDLSELKAITSEYKHLPKPGGLRGKGEEPFNLFSTLEKLTAQNELMPNIEYMRPGGLQLDTTRDEKWVELKLNRVTLKEMTAMLHSLESVGKGVYIKRLSIRKEGEYLTVILQPAVIEIRQPGQKAGGLTSLR
jgi:hypothetical protein